VQFAILIFRSARKTKPFSHTRDLLRSHGKKVIEAFFSCRIDNPTNDGAAGPKSMCRLSNEWIPVRPVVPISREEPNAHTIAANHHSEAVMLNFVNPARAFWGPISKARQARSNKADNGIRDTREAQTLMSGNSGLRTTSPMESCSAVYFSMEATSQ
jgi:hypothetical protein